MGAHQPINGTKHRNDLRTAYKAVGIFGLSFSFCALLPPNRTPNFLFSCSALAVAASIRIDGGNAGELDYGTKIPKGIVSFIHGTDRRGRRIYIYFPGRSMGRPKNRRLEMGSASSKIYIYYARVATRSGKILAAPTLSGIGIIENCCPPGTKISRAARAIRMP